MNSVVIKLFLGSLVIGALFFLIFRALKFKQTVNFYNQKIKLVSEHADYKLKLSNPTKLYQLIKSKNLIDSEFSNLNNKRISIDQAIITLTNNEQTQQVIKWSEKNIITHALSGDYSIDKNVLNIKIYIIPNNNGLYDMRFSNVAINHQLIRILCAASAKSGADNQNIDECIQLNTKTMVSSSIYQLFNPPMITVNKS